MQHFFINHLLWSFSVKVTELKQVNGKKNQISSAEEFCNTFLGGVAAAEGNETCTKSSEVQGGGGDVAGVPKGVPFPPAEKEHKFSQQAPKSSFQLNIECE